jgi:signal transduction histidine kinase
MLVASGLLAVVLGAAFVVLIFAMREQRQSARLALRSQEAIAAGQELQKTVVSMDTGVRGFVANGSPHALAPWYGGLRDYPAQSRHLERLVSDVPSQRAAAAGAQAAIVDYVDLWARPLIALARSRPAVARSVSGNATGRERVDAIRRRFEALFGSERAVATKREQRAESRSDLAEGLATGGVALALAAALALALYLGRAIVRPVRRVAGAAEQIAGGDLQARVRTRRVDEFGDLARAFNSMAQALESGRSQLMAQTQELERSNRELDHFASVTSHDLKEPLITVARFAELLKRRYGGRLDATADQIVDAIVAGSDRMQALIRDLLEYSRVGHGEPRREPTSFEALLESTRANLEGKLSEQAGTLTADPLPVVEGDPKQLAQVLQNLVSNGLKFSDGGPPRVHVSAVAENGGWRFSVRDNGIGIDPAHAARIFQPFERLHAQDRYEGTGIGLAICQKIVERHGGRIWVDSAPGEGSTFHFTLPSRDSGAAPSAAAAARAASELDVD